MPIISSISAGARSLGIYVMTLLVSVTDTFNRSNNTTDLGSISGQKWKIWRSAWQILTNKAYSATDPTSYPMATLTFTRTDVTVSISGMDPGLGAAFWVTDANNWYASVYTQTQVCQTCVGCSGTYNTSTCNAYNAQNCTTTYNAGTCTTTYNAGTCTTTYNAGTCATTYNAGTCVAYNAGTCSVGQNCNNTPGNCGFGTFCCAPGVNPTTYNACAAYACNVFNSANTGNKSAPFGFCFGPTRFCSSGQNAVPGNCSNGNCCNGSFPTWSPFCSGVYNACTGWNVRNCGGTYNAQNCGGVFNAQNCGGAFNARNCGGAFNVQNCGGAFNAQNCGGNFNPSNCNQPFFFSCNCQTEHRINLIKAIAGTVSSISQNLFSAAIVSFKTALSGNNATITAYSAVNYVAQIGNPVVTSISPAPVKTNMHGIIKSSSPYAQGTSIDDFGVN